MKASQIAAKAAVRLFLLLLLFGLIPYFYGEHSTRLQHLDLIIYRSWRLIFPGILIAGFLTLLISCIVKKYSVIEMNWLLVLNTVILMIYGVALYIHIYQMVK